VTAPASKGFGPMRMVSRKGMGKHDGYAARAAGVGGQWLSHSRNLPEALGGNLSAQMSCFNWIFRF
jgi:hypothetical protein